MKGITTNAIPRLIACLLALALLGGLLGGAALADGGVTDVVDAGVIRAAVESRISGTDIFAAAGSDGLTVGDAPVADVSDAEAADAPAPDGAATLPWCRLDSSSYDQTFTYGDEGTFTLYMGYGSYSPLTAAFVAIVYAGSNEEGNEVDYIVDLIESSYSTHTLTMPAYEFDAGTYYLVVAALYQDSTGEFVVNEDSLDYCEFTVAPRSVAGASVTLTPSAVNAGSAPTSAAVVVDGRTLTQDVDYTVRYADYASAGTGTATVTGRGNYTGTATATFTVKAQLPFTDVPSNASYYAALQWAYGSGIVKGTSATTFSPNDDCTRGQFALMLYRLAGKPDVTGVANPFKDVKSSAAYYRAVLWAYNEGIIKGTSATTFNPNGTVTRGQIVLMLYRMAGKPAVTNTTNPFSDVKPSDSCYRAVLWAVEKGITKGTSATTFAPNNPCTRYQLVLFLYRFNNIMGYI